MDIIATMMKEKYNLEIFFANKVKVFTFVKIK
jgi:hypothetical protein